MPPSGHLAVRGDVFDRVMGGRGATTVEWVKPRDAAKHPTTHWTVPTTKHYLVQNVYRNSAVQASTSYQIIIQQYSVKLQDDSEYFWWFR